ncbi:MAG: N-acetylmuramidase family protein [Hyphomicrobiaceae bacterium]|nr:N-acetylmuramidase family protein [Hyphomicrobiaceae bacterium]
MLGKGRAEAITDAHTSQLATELGVHPADIEAIATVESNGFGWFEDGRIKILFEKHWFYKLLSGADRTKAVRQGLARKNWVSPKRGGYKDQSNADARYRLLAKAIAINEESALRSISMGRFQIMGFNYGLCGFVSAKHMWERFLDSEVNQLRALAKFLEKKGLVEAMRNRDFRKIETVYNGGGLGGAYARRMKAASDKLRAGKWKGWTPTQKPVEPPKPVPPVIAATPSPEPRPAPAQGGLWALFASILKKLAGG